MMKFLLIFGIFLTGKVHAQHYRVFESLPDNAFAYSGNVLRPQPEMTSFAINSDSLVVGVLLTWTNGVDDHIYFMDHNLKWREYPIFVGETITLRPHATHLVIIVKNQTAENIKYKFDYGTGSYETISPPQSILSSQR